LEQAAGAHIFIPLILAYTHFIQVEPHQFPAGLFDLAEQIEDLFGFKTTLDGSSGMRTKFGIQSVDVKADVNLFGQMIDDLIGDLSPGLSFEDPFADLLVEISDHAKTAAGDVVHFFFTIIPHPYLHQFLQLRDLFNGIVHYGCMGIYKSFIGFSQVAMRIDLEDAEVAVLFCNGLEISKWCAVITAQSANQFTLGQEVAGLFIDPIVQKEAPFIDLTE